MPRHARTLALCRAAFRTPRPASVKSSASGGWPSIVRGSALADTGALLALLNRSDIWHVRCAEAFKTLGLPLVTTTAVLTELFHLAAANGIAPSTTWELIHAVT